MTKTELCIDINQRIIALENLKNESQSNIRMLIINDSIKTFNNLLFHLDSLLSLSLSVRCYNMLVRGGIDTVSKLKLATGDELAEIQGITGEMISEIRKSLQLFCNHKGISQDV